jgi:hypothetical protein
MTKGEACGLLLQHYIDDTVMSYEQRRECITAIPSECRYTLPDGSGRLAVLDIIQAVLDDIEFNNAEKEIEGRNG